MFKVYGNNDWGCYIYDDNTSLYLWHDGTTCTVCVKIPATKPIISSNKWEEGWWKIRKEANTFLEEWNKRQSIYLTYPTYSHCVDKIVEEDNINDKISQLEQKYQLLSKEIEELKRTIRHYVSITR